MAQGIRVRDVLRYLMSNGIWPKLKQRVAGNAFDTPWQAAVTLVDFIESPRFSIIAEEDVALTTTVLVALVSSGDMTAVDQTNILALVVDDC